MKLETTFESYIVDELIGEGGAGRVYGGETADGRSVALKVLVEDKATTDKRRRFKNEVAFLGRNRHRNIVSVIDHGVAHERGVSGPFYVMNLYDGNLRTVMNHGIPTESVLSVFSQILDGVEAAHLQGVIHRDLKPENVLFQGNPVTYSVGDFGIARFSEDILVTAVKTMPKQRMANFAYAAPEQRAEGGAVGKCSDIYALGLLLNELFTGAIPQGTDYAQIGEVDRRYEYLDHIVAEMIRQDPAKRPGTIADVKGLILKYEHEAVSQQKLSEIDGTVIPKSTIDNPLALEPPALVGFDWNNGQLELIFDRKVSPEWVLALQNMGSFTAVMGFEPKAFTFRGNKAIVSASDSVVQDIINHFKPWLQKATDTLRDNLEAEARRAEIALKSKLRAAREVEEKRLRVLRNTKI